MSKFIYIASDHGGFELKEKICTFLKDLKYSVKDLGTFSEESVDYPDFASKLCDKILKNKSLGILICGTGIGMSISANKRKGIRAALCLNEFMAKMSREHNDANVLCLGARIIGDELAKSIAAAWLDSRFSSEERHLRRINKIE